METKPASVTKPYLLLFRNTGEELFRPLGPEQRQQLIDRWNTWYDRLLEQGKAIEAQPLEAETRTVSGVGGTRITDGPFPEAKEAIGGYVKVMVSSFDEAVAIAQQHPALAVGMKIEVRETVDECHMGVRIRKVASAAASS